MEEIKRLIEDRQVQAIKREITKKLMCIVRNMGQPIYGNTGFGTGLNVNSYDPDAWLLEEERLQGGDLLLASADDYSSNGYLYDALSIGHNFEIRYMDTSLRAKYDGHIVYLEEEGKLKAYVPEEKWEQLVAGLYAKAKPLDDQRRVKDKEESKAWFMKQAAKFLEELRKSWGF